jgi:hypothetical protein
MVAKRLALVLAILLVAFAPSARPVGAAAEEGDAIVVDADIVDAIRFRLEQGLRADREYVEAIVSRLRYGWTCVWDADDRR